MKTTLTPGACEVSDADEGRENPGAPEQGIEKHAASRSWSMTEDQLEKHLRGLDVKAPARAPRARSEDHPWQGLSKGDRGAMADAANERRKQRES